MALKFHKVTTLPNTLEADSFYFVNNGNYAESYITNSTGTAKSIGNSSMISAIADARISAYEAAAARNAVEIVADIGARDALAASVNRNLLILVSDARGDLTVTSGAALYAWNESGAHFTKLTEYESIDVTVFWSNISGRPSSSPSLIDDAVNKRHVHANFVQLEKIGESAGALTYGGALVGSNWSTINW